MQSYGGGIIKGNCGTRLDHAVVAVGYGTENGVDFWIIRNSWGAGWGEKGYLRILREKEEGPGVCGINMDNTYPTF